MSCYLLDERSAVMVSLILHKYFIDVTKCFFLEKIRNFKGDSMDKKKSFNTSVLGGNKQVIYFT